MMHDARSIAQIMGGEAQGRDSVLVPGPGHSAKDRSLSIKLSGTAPDGFIVHSHADDDPILCRDYVRDRLGLERFDPRNNNPPQFTVATEGSDADARERKQFAEKIWTDSTDPRNTIVERYLRDVRGLELPSGLALSVVRYHARLKYDDHFYPAMVCLLRNIKTDEPTGIHRTFLGRNAEKIDRRMLGIAKGAAIKIDPRPGIDGRLTIGEGFETALASRLADLGPAWALGSAGAMKAFPVVKDVSRLTVLEENDTTGTSAKAVAACRARYLKSRQPVHVITPRPGLSDFADVYREARRK